MSQKRGMTTSSETAGTTMIPGMKKSKPQVSSDSLEKNGLQHYGPDDDAHSDMMLVDVKNDNTIAVAVPMAMVLGGGSSAGGTFANLSRKKATPPQPIKKLVIKPFKDKPKLPSDFEDATWAKIKEAVTAIHLKQPVSCSLEELYQAVEGLCLHKMASNLYYRLQQECEVHISEKIDRLIGQSPDTVIFLSQVKSAGKIIASKCS